MSGIVLVTVPIGNKDDITFRALESLKTIKNIFCEDTRVFKELCQRIGLDYSSHNIRCFHDHSADHVVEGIISLAEREDCVFVSDAGSPIIADPAFPLVLKAIEKGIDIKTNGGINSIITALELSGLAPIPFKFHGFVPRDKGKLTQQLKEFGNEYGTHIFFEGKSRVMATLEQVSGMYPNFKFCLARELTKQFETVHRFIGKDFESIDSDFVEKGEFVILMENNNKNSKMIMNDELIDLATQIIEKGSKPKILAKLLGTITGKPTKEIYQVLSGTRQ